MQLCPYIDVRRGVRPPSYQEPPPGRRGALGDQICGRFRPGEVDRAVGPLVGRLPGALGIHDLGSGPAILGRRPDVVCGFGGFAPFLGARGIRETVETTQHESSKESILSMP